MAELKYSFEMDGLGFLYRSALYLAQGKEKQALEFLDKAEEKIKNYFNEDLKNFNKQPGLYLGNQKKATIWAEKILDEYRRIFMLRR